MAQGKGFIPTGSLHLDIALRTGGLERGQIVEISGPEGSGKTTLCQHLIAEAQKLGDVCAWIDVDHAIDPDYARRCGVNPELLYISDPKHAEQALGTLETLAKSGEVAVLVLDSINSLTPRKEFVVAMGKRVQDHSNRLLSQCLRNLSFTIRILNTTIIFTKCENYKALPEPNLSRNPIQLALQLHAELRLKLHSTGAIRKDGKVIGKQIQVRVIKSKIPPCSQVIRFDIIYNNGIIKAGEIYDLGNQLGIINKQGQTFYYQAISLGDGRVEAIDFLKGNPSTCKKIEQDIRQKSNPPVAPSF